MTHAFDGELVLLKLGGSLITHKDRPFTPREDRLHALAQAIARALEQRPDLRLIVGHGSGSFGHPVARRYRTREGVHNSEQWWGFTQVARAAAQLHRLVLEALWSQGLPALSLPPSATVLARGARVHHWCWAPLEAALARGLLPVVYGDAVLDLERGGTVLSTEDLFVALAARFRPRRVLLVGREPGVWADYPQNTRLVDVLTPARWARWARHLGPSHAPDVTGGMREKVRLMVHLAEHWGIEGWIFGGDPPERVTEALLGRLTLGTRVLPDEKAPEQAMT